MNQSMNHQNETTGVTGNCVACGADGLRVALDLGVQPPANFLMNRSDDVFPTYPLGLAHCPKCGHGQLIHFVPPAELFRHYLYASGTSGTLGAYFDWFRAEVEACFPKDSSILEIACNDGSLLARLAEVGYSTLGVDPAENLVDTARQRGLSVIADFWPCPEAIQGKKFDLIIAMNVVAHTPEPLRFLLGVADALSDNGVCLIQTSQAQMLVNGEFDTIYHEHYSFFTPQSMAVLAERAGLELRVINLVNIHGVSFAFVVSKPNIERDLGHFLRSAPFGLEQGTAPGPLAQRVMGTLEQYKNFGDEARERMSVVKAIIARAKESGRNICFVGAAAKALTFIGAAKIIPDYIFDEAPLKIGRYIPMVERPISNLSEISNISGDILVVISAWNFRDELVKKVKEYCSGKDTSFLTYFPDIAEFT